MIQLAKSRRFSTSFTLAALTVALAVPALASTAFANPVAGAPTEVTEASAAAAAGARGGARVNVSGEVARYVVGPLGHVRGFLLKDGTAVVVHGVAGDAMAKDVALGQTVRVEGVSPTASGGKAIFHAAVYGQHGQIVSPPTSSDRDAERTARQAERSEMRAAFAKLPEASANGTVAAVIPGHRGRPMAVVLNDGTSVFFHHSLAKEIVTRGIRVGDQIRTTGKGATYPQGASVLVRAITFADGTHFESKPRVRAPEQATPPAAATTPEASSAI